MSASGAVTTPGPALLEVVRPLGRLSAVRAPLEVALTWATIALAIALYLAYPTPWMFVLAFLVVGSRQYALLILMHDAFHSLVHRNGLVNDFVGAVLIGAPCGSAYWHARAAHLKHHRRLGKDDDPEFFLHCAGPPRDKRTTARLLRHLFLLISGGQVLYTHFGAAVPGDGSRGRRLLSALPRIARVGGAQLVLLGVFALAGSWTTYFTLWLLPLTTLTVILNGLRAFCDHATVADEEDDERLATYASTPVERFFLAPFHMNFHAEHHLFPYVPHYRLPALRSHLSAAAEYRAAIRWREGYFGFVRQFLRSQRRTTTSL